MKAFAVCSLAERASLRREHGETSEGVGGMNPKGRDFQQGKQRGQGPWGGLGMLQETQEARWLDRTEGGAGDRR